jgi:hypothetical protein
LIDVFGKEGEIAEHIFDSCGIDDNIDRKGKRKDELVLMRRRCVLLTSDELFVREEKKKQDKIDAAARKEQERIERANRLQYTKNLNEQKKQQRQEMKAHREIENQKKAEARLLKACLNMNKSSSSS